MKYCPKCRKKLIVKDFCVECGADLSEYLNDESQNTEEKIFNGTDISVLEKEAQKQLNELKKNKELLERFFEVSDNGDGTYTLLKIKDINATSVIIPETIRRIGSGAFKYCESLKKVEILYGTTVIDIDAFYGCKRLEKISLPSSIKRIKDSAFSYCELLKKISIPNKVEYIDDRVFCGCTSLEEVILPEGLKSIGEWAFAGCYSLKDIKIPSNVSWICSEAFQVCKSLKNVIIPHNCHIDIDESTASFPADCVIKRI